MSSGKQGLFLLTQEDLMEARDLLEDSEYTLSAGIDGTVLVAVSGFFALHTITSMVDYLRRRPKGVIIDARNEPLIIRNEDSLPKGSVVIRQPNGEVTFKESSGNLPSPDNSPTSLAEALTRLLTKDDGK